MTIKSALKLAAHKLTQANIDSALLDAEILLAHVLKKSKEFLFTYPEKKLSSLQVWQYQRLIKQRLNFIPVAYLIGEKEFFGYKFKVNKNVLVPRPLTEQIVELALKQIQSEIGDRESDIGNQGKQYSPHDSRFTTHDFRYTIHDIGTGSGCIIIALALELKKQNLLDQVELFATDISAKALKVAKANAKSHNLGHKIKFLKGDLLRPLKKIQPDLILANLPYLDKKDVHLENSIQAEPKKALIGDLYLKLLRQVDRLPRKPVLIFEDKTGVHYSDL